MGLKYHQGGLKIERGRWGGDFAQCLHEVSTSVPTDSFVVQNRAGDLKLCHQLLVLSPGGRNEREDPFKRKNCRETNWGIGMLLF